MRINTIAPQAHAPWVTSVPFIVPPEDSRSSGRSVVNLGPAHFPRRRLVSGVNDIAFAYKSALTSIITHLPSCCTLAGLTVAICL
jgi:hypothetical protein